MNTSKLLKSVLGIIPIIILLIMWEILARRYLVTGKIYLPPFSAIIGEFYHLIVSGILIKNFLSSFLRVLIGFTIGTITGIAIGILTGWYSLLDKALSPLISLLYPIPALGWLPLLMLWLGIGELLPITIIFICSFFPISYNTSTGIKTVDKDYIKVAKTLGASDKEILFLIVLPLSLPHIFTGLKLESGMACRVIVAAEMIAIPTGIGALMMRAESLMRIDIIIVCLIILAIMCFLFEKLFLLLEYKFTGKWK